MNQGAESVLFKLMRAQHHVRVLEEELAEWSQSKPFGFRSETSADRLQVTLHHRVDHEAPPTIGLLIGDAIQNYRIALDHLLFNIPRAPGTDRRWQRWSQFPITDDATSFAGAKNNTLGMDFAAIKAIEGLQPYFGGRDPVGHPIWYLRELSTLDNHRILHVVAMLPRNVKVALPPPPTGTLRVVFAEGVALENAVLGKLYYSNPALRGVDMEVSITYGITVKGLEPPVGILTVMDFIDRAVVESISKLATFL